ncbi:thiamine pyrophosphate-binding protein [Wohlfahrtiimonas chitiniclastica]|uniref:thiamine pyrophosphate-binding protein n=1 Tax=Wohlfahrtiimonas chitiniclastica TaxID=400946 RepID=UPI0021575112|nr:thiamine pyrophosphate-binding protein [Wohlfahrtiimonas chitiniclastica]MDC7252201.1 thiamine pyrophosphate protein [Wohlfahrtiimonas chitiniclastica]
MHETRMPRTGGEILVDQLLIQGIKQGFYVPSQNDDALLMPLQAAIELITAWQTDAALMMAEAYGKLASHPGIAFVMSHDGMLDVINGLHIAMQAATPMIVFVKTRTHEQGLTVLNDVYSAVKWAAIIDEARLMPAIIGRAFHQASSGRCGPVVVMLPENVLTECACIADGIPIAPVTIAPSMNDLAQFEQMLNFARNPILILCGSQWHEKAVARIEQFAARYALSTAVEGHHSVLFDTTHEAFIGEVGLDHPALMARIDHADLVIICGGTLHDAWLNAPVPLQTLIHIHPDINALNAVYHADLAINATPEAFTQALLGIRLYNNWLDILQKDRADYAAWQCNQTEDRDDVSMDRLMQAFNTVLPDDAIITHGQGAYVAALHRFYHFKHPGTHVATALKTTGYGIAAAMAAKALHPTRTVVCLMDDHECSVSSEALLSAQDHALGIVILVCGQMPVNAAYVCHTMDEFFAASAAAIERAARGTPVILHCLFTDDARMPLHTLTDGCNLIQKEVMSSLSQ